MASSKGLTLMEIVIVLVIVAALIAIAIPNYANSVYNYRVQGVEHNLRAIGAAQSKYYEDHGYYCSPAVPIPDIPGCADFAHINSNLSLNMASVNDGFTYNACLSSGTCSATSTSPSITVSVDANGNITCSTGTCP